MKLQLECVSFYVRQALDAAKMTTDDRKLHEQVLRGAWLRHLILTSAVSVLRCRQKLKKSRQPSLLHKYS